MHLSTAWICSSATACAESLRTIPSCISIKQNLFIICFLVGMRSVLELLVSDWVYSNLNTTWRIIVVIHELSRSSWRWPRLHLILNWILSFHVIIIQFISVNISFFLSSDSSQLILIPSLPLILYINRRALSRQVPREWHIYIGTAIILGSIRLVFSPWRWDFIEQILVIVVDRIHKSLGLHELNAQVPHLEGALLLASHELTHIDSRIINSTIPLLFQFLIIYLKSLLLIALVQFLDLFNTSLKWGLSQQIVVSLAAHVLEQSLVVIFPLEGRTARSVLLVVILGEFDQTDTWGALGTQLFLAT